MTAHIEEFIHVSQGGLTIRLALKAATYQELRTSQGNSWYQFKIICFHQGLAIYENVKSNMKHKGWCCQMTRDGCNQPYTVVFINELSCFAIEAF